jgi:hypothetical protein
MSMSNLAYARLAFQFFSRSARHIYQLIAGHQNPETGWAYLSYACLAKESGLSPRRVMQLVAFLEANHALEVRRGHGRGHVNFYRILREEDGLPVPHRSSKPACRQAGKVKSETPIHEEKVKFPTPPEPEKVKSETPNLLESLQNMPDKVVETKEREKKGAPPAPVSLSSHESTDTPERSGIISPEVMRKFGIRYGTEEWPPQRHKD